MRVQRGMTSDGRTRSWAKTAAVTGVVLVAAAGVLALRAHHSSPTPEPPVSPPPAAGRIIAAPAPNPAPNPSPSPASVSSPASGPGAQAKGMATAAGAVTEAVAIVDDEPLLVTVANADAEALVRSWAVPAASARLVAEFRSSRASLVDAKGGPFGFQVGVLAVKAAGRGADRVVAVWCAEVVFDRSQPSATTFLTEDLHLTWSSGRWRLRSMTESPGPAVSLSGTATPPAEAAAALAGFTPTGSWENGGSSHATR